MLKKDIECNPSCRCIECGNGQAKVSSPSKGCRCNAVGDSAFQACNDNDKQRRSKCKCYRSKTGCSKFCRCKNCCNTFGKVDNTLVKNLNTRKRRLDRTYKKERASSFLETLGNSTLQAGWSDFETIALYCCAESTSLVDPLSNISSIILLFNEVVTYSQNELSKKTDSQTRGKLAYILQLQE